MRHNRSTMRTRIRHASALTVGSAAGGLMAYLFFALVTRALGSVDAAPVSVLWAYWSFAGAALTFPLQHWVTRTIAAHEGEGAVRAALPGVAGVAVAVALVATAASWLGREQLFGGDEPWFPLLVCGVTAASAAMGMMRGVLSARHRFTAVGVGLFAENAVRCAAALALFIAGVDEPVAYGLALLAGYGVVLAQPSIWRLERGGSGGHESPLGFLGGTAGGQLMGQTVLTGGPVVLALAGGAPAEITALFAALALFRAPYTLAIGVVSSATGWLTRLVVERDVAALRRTRHRVVLAAALVSVAAGVLGWVLGPWALALVFGSDVTMAGHLTALIAVGSTVAMANLVVTLVVVAHGRTALLAVSWLVAVVPGAVCFVLLDLPALDRTCWAFVVVEVAALGVLVLQEARATRTLA
jgi:O-antigen/teichoic acid export membrane protein